MPRALLGLRINRRLATTASVCAIVVMTAGALAMVVAQGVLIASILLTGAFLVGVVGVAYANDRSLGYGVAVLLAAALPLFLGLQAIGFAILRRMGPGVAGGLLMAVGGFLACFSIWSWVTTNHPRGNHL